MLCWLVGLNLWCRLLLGGSAVGALDHAIRLLFAAAQTGKRDEVAAVTDAIERVLRERQLL